MDAKTFFEHDFGACLFPLNTNLLLIRHHEAGLKAYITKVLSDDPQHKSDSFLAQTRVHAAKPRNHLRRTVILDPVASYFLYDLVARNRAVFGKHIKPLRRSFGYTLGTKGPAPVSKAYREFIRAIEKSKKHYKHHLSFDIASYFNSIYVHDATHWFGGLPDVSGADVAAFGRFFREVNAGRSIDFLPQGIYPAKMIGSEFLRFVDSFAQIKSVQLLRFMDDFHLFDNNLDTVIQDFLRIQEILGIKALNVNPTKTALDMEGPSIRAQASAIQAELADFVDGNVPTRIHLGSGADPYDFEDEDGEDGESLDEAHIQRLHALLMDPGADESDVELILGILQKNTEDVTEHISNLIARFPNIVKQLHKLAGLVPDKEELAKNILALLKSQKSLIEYQHFWIAMIAEDHLSETSSFGDLVLKLWERAAEHRTARAKILEIPDQSFGLKEIRDEQLKTGASDWLSWASAIGTRTLKKAQRNHALQYFSKGSPLNFLISECVQKLP
jgi:hypothetical protein